MARIATGLRGRAGRAGGRPFSLPGELFFPFPPDRAGPFFPERAGLFRPAPLLAFRRGGWPDQFSDVPRRPAPAWQARLPG